MSDEIDTSPDEVEGAARFAESDYIQWYDGADLEKQEEKQND